MIIHFDTFPTDTNDNSFLLKHVHTLPIIVRLCHLPKHSKIATKQNKNRWLQIIC